MPTTQINKQQMHMLGITQEQVKDLQKTFVFFDKNKSGFIEADELETALKMMGENPTRADVDAMIKKADTVCQDGKVEFLEFCQLMMRADQSPRDREEELRQLFTIIDKDKTGFINEEELRIALTQDGRDFTAKELKATFTYADKDKDGKISFQEFVDLLSHSTEEMKKKK